MLFLRNQVGIPTSVQKYKKGSHGWRFCFFLLILFLLISHLSLSLSLSVHIFVLIQRTTCCVQDMLSSIEPGTSIRDDERLIQFPHVPSYSEFYNRGLLPNRPCLFPPDLVAHWNVVQSNAWADGSQVNWSALKREYASHVAPVVITRTSSEERRTEMTISDAVDLIQRRDGQVGSIYIKDWHLVKQLGQGEVEPYTVPEIFADDWMNNLDGKDKDDFRFVYAGTAGSQTLLHRDVYMSYSWSTNVVGEKRWCLFPPHVIPALRRFPNVETSELIPDVESLLSTVKDNTQGYALLHQARAHMQVIHQLPGETIFIPSNWYHQVSNLTDCISINRNWCNSANLPSLYRSIVDELRHVEHSLCDVKEMLSEAGRDEWKAEFYALVQDVAVKDAGWAWAGFWDMVLHNLQSPATTESLRPKDSWMRDRLTPLLNDFLQRQDARWLDAKIRETAEKCRALLQNPMD